MPVRTFVRTSAGGTSIALGTGSVQTANAFPSGGLVLNDGDAFVVEDTAIQLSSTEGSIVQPPSLSLVGVALYFATQGSNTPLLYLPVSLVSTGLYGGVNNVVATMNPSVGGSYGFTASAAELQSGVLASGGAASSFPLQIRLLWAFTVYNASATTAFTPNPTVVTRYRKFEGIESA